MAQWTLDKKMQVMMQLGHCYHTTYYQINVEVLQTTHSCDQPAHQLAIHAQDSLLRKEFDVNVSHARVEDSHVTHS